MTINMYTVYSYQATALCYLILSVQKEDTFVLMLDTLISWFGTIIFFLTILNTNTDLQFDVQKIIANLDLNHNYGEKNCIIDIFLTLFRLIFWYTN